MTEDAGSRLEISDDRVSATGQSFAFTGTLTAVQREAVTLTRRPRARSFGRAARFDKTIVACALIAMHATSTLILVDRKALADQWCECISEFLGV
jgi:superfamily II DNA or RNA helicase